MTRNPSGRSEQSCRIHLIRHGQTAMNVEQRFRGLLDVPLSEIGRAEAWEAAHNLAGSGVSVVYSSPLQRAREVADAIASTSGNLAVRNLDLLLNLDYGRWEGLTRVECALADPAAWNLYADEPERAACPGGESLATAADRIVGALRTIGRAHQGETVAAVSHGVMLRLAVLRVVGPSDEDWQFALPTGSALIFEVNGENIELVSALDRSIPKHADAVTLGETG
jgi:broad specificity phosphatase PhoE